MAKTTAPLLSFDARGQVGQTQVYSSWRGRKYVRRQTIPSNPQTAEQTTTRSVFSWLQQVYKLAPPDFVAPWQAYIVGKPLTDRNAFTQFNLPVLRPDTDLDSMVGSPGALGGLAPATATPTPGNDQVTVAITAPAAPTGWSVDSAIAAVIRQQDPHSGILYTISVGTDATSPYSINITGLADSVQYRGWAWLKWLRPDGKFAYSPSIGYAFTTT